jgi:hypothetical protein
MCSYSEKMETTEADLRWACTQRPNFAAPTPNCQPAKMVSIEKSKSGKFLVTLTVWLDPIDNPLMDERQICPMSLHAAVGIAGYSSSRLGEDAAFEQAKEWGLKINRSEFGAIMAHEGSEGKKGLYSVSQKKPIFGAALQQAIGKVVLIVAALCIWSVLTGNYERTVTVRLPDSSRY